MEIYIQFCEYIWIAANIFPVRYVFEKLCQVLMDYVCLWYQFQAVIVVVEIVPDNATLRVLFFDSVRDKAAATKKV